MTAAPKTSIIRDQFSGAEWKTRFDLAAAYRLVAFYAWNDLISAQKDGLLPISQQAMFPSASLAYHDYEGLALNEAEKPRLVSDLGDKKNMILRNHGLLTIGSTVAEAFLSMYLLERACRIQILAQSGGGDLHRIKDSIVNLVARQQKAVTVGQGAELVWPGLLRKLDRIDSSYR